MPRHRSLPGPTFQAPAPLDGSGGSCGHGLDGPLNVVARPLGVRDLLRDLNSFALATNVVALDNDRLLDPALDSIPTHRFHQRRLVQSTART